MIQKKQKKPTIKVTKTFQYQDYHLLLKDYYAFHEDPTRPQPRMERTVGDGMTTTIGRVEKEELFDNGLKYMLFSHNKKMGSAKGAVLVSRNVIQKR